MNDKGLGLGSALTILLLITLLISGCTGGGNNIKWPTHDELIPADAVKQTPAMDPTPPVLHSDKWEKPVPMPFPISSAGAEDSPYIKPDGSGFFFFFTPDVSKNPATQMGEGATGIYYSEKVSDGWSAPQRVRLEKDPTTALDGCAVLRGDVLWFCSVRNGGYRDIDLYSATVDGSKASDVKNAGKRLNQEIEVGELDFSPDGTELYFHSDKAGGQGDMDIYVTKNVHGEWQDAVPIDAVNTAQIDGFPFITQDGKELWFTRFYQGTPAVFRTLWNGTGWGAPELIISSFAGEPNLDAKGNIYFVHHYYNNGTMIEADIYVAYKK